MWGNIIVNDPNDDFNLMIELWYNDKNCGVLKWNQTDKQYELNIFPNDVDFVISCDMLKTLLLEIDSLKSTRNI